MGRFQVDAGAGAGPARIDPAGSRCPHIAGTGLQDTMFGFGAGIFFLTYFIFELPSNLFLDKFGARKWIARIMITWGVLASMTGLVHSGRELYWARFFLGLAEAGFFPGMIVFLTHWFRGRDRARAVALFMTAIPISQLIGAPVSGLLMRVHWMGLSGWRWLLILEGVPAVIFGVITIFYLTDWPRDATWLQTPHSQNHDGVATAWLTSPSYRFR